MSNVKIITLEDKINGELVKENVTDKVIAELKSKFGGMKLRSVDNKEDYLIIKEAKKEVSKWRILATKICKAGREDAIAEQKLWLAKEKEVVGKINEVEIPLQAEIDKFDAEVERKGKEEQERKDAMFINRQAQLTRLGAMYSDGCFILDTVSFESSVIKEADEEMYLEKILPKYQVVYEKIEAERIESEILQKEREDKLKKEREELEQQQKAFAEQQSEFKKQQDEAAMKLREQQLQKEKEETAQRQHLINHRSAILSGLGMTFNGSEYKYEDVNVHHTEMGTLNETEWVTLIAKITPIIAERKNDAEQKRLADIAEQETRNKLKVVGEARFQVLKDMGFTNESEVNLRELPEHEWKQMYDAFKLSYDNQQRKKWEEEQAENKRQYEIKRKQEEQRQAEELAKSSDKEKFIHFLSQLNSLVLPEFKSSIYKGKLSICKEKIEEINNL